MLNNRDWATLIWLGILAVYVLRHAPVRASVTSVFRVFIRPVIAIPLLVMLAYTTLLIYFGREFGLWSTALIKDSVVWFAATALVLFMNVVKSAKGKFFRKAAMDTVKATVFLEFFLNLFAMSLPVELILLPVLFFVATIPIVVRGNPRHAAAVRVANRAAIAIGWGMLGFVLWKLVVDWRDVGNVGTVQSLALPVWLTLGLLPFIYAVSLWINYSSAFARIDIATRETRRRRRAKLALVTVLHLRTAAAGSFNWPWVRRAVDSASFRDVRHVVKDYVKARRTDLAGATG